MIERLGWIRRRPAVAAAAAVVTLAVVLHVPVFRIMGASMVVDASTAGADVAIMTTDAGRPGLLELADLYAQHVVSRVGYLQPAPGVADSELRRRGAYIDAAAEILARLGIPASAIAVIPAGEGGTTDGTAALGAWCRANGIRRILVVTSAEHARRVRRAFRRVAGDVQIAMHRSRWDDFEADQWWHNRGSARRGLIEFQKLALDVLSHPLQ
jgi:uncharacterized SAM-binding protein YcdF (DUF218 family)